MSVYKTHKTIIPPTDLVGDVERKVKITKDGSQVITYEQVDYPKIVAENGKFGDWRLNNLLAAGINPDFPIHTGSGSRIENFGDLGSISADVDTLFAEEAPAEEK